MSDVSLKVSGSFLLNESACITRLTLGQEKIPLLIIDNFVRDPDELIAAAEGGGFAADGQNFYPGKRKPAPGHYSRQLSEIFLFHFKAAFGLENAVHARTLASTFAISDTSLQQLRPIQMLPHFDTCDSHQFALVHYLCGEEHGGTSFYRHRSTGFETISESRLAVYGPKLKQQAIASQLHKNPAYINGSNDLFEQIFSVDAAMNRMIIYPSKALHSGNINPDLGLSSEPKQGRLTISSFIVVG
ncbi:DUF6445 family protein [Thalassomonas actiniarum]|uniref:Uncharacterized protein n=1 Tax=Thalassomonas actiniarum TaxID=485447 RepID=A0AAF0C1J2_9GAMM|nr:DUF6445 family protein [Thalassomonas actiniarum]WDD97492.1 hypothetical protein SG35_019510 [Thalassomonas actiniarum]